MHMIRPDSNFMTVRILGGLDELQSISAQWSDLVRRCPSATIFQTFEWIFACCQWVEKSGKLFIVTVWQGELLVAAAPLVQHSSRYWGRLLRFVGNDVLDYQMILVDASRSAAYPAILETLSRNSSEWNFIELRDIPDFSQNVPFLLAGGATAVHAHHMAVTHDSLCCRLAIPADPKSYITELNYKNRKARKGMAFEVKDLATPEDWENGLELLFQLHQERWTAVREAGAFLHTDIRELHRYLVHSLLKTGNVHLLGLFAEGIPLAVSYLFEKDKIYYAYISGRNTDPAWERYSLGSQIRREAIKKGIEAGIHTFDMLRGDENYKVKLFNATAYPNTDIIFCKRPLDFMKYRLLLSYQRVRSRVPVSFKTWIKWRLRQALHR